METLDIDIDRIDLGDRLRPVDPERVAEMAVSISEQGLIQPILVRQVPGGRFEIVVGAHRLTACLGLGMTKIAARVFEGTATEARLAEIDENLYRHELTPLDQAAFVAERRRLFEEINGKVARGRPEKNTAKLRQLSFFDETTQKFGLSRDMIERALKRRTKIADDVWGKLKGTAAARSGALLDALARLDHTQQRVVVKKSEREKKDLIEVIRELGAPRGSGEADGYERLLTAWRKADKDERRRFVDHLVESGDIDAARG